MVEPIAQLIDVSVLAHDPHTPGPDRWIVRGVSFDIPARGCTALLGPNGCGKSTLARVLLGQVWPTRGTVKLLGQTLGQTDIQSLRRRVQLVQAQAFHQPHEAMTALQTVLTGLFGTIELFEDTTPQQDERALELLTQMDIGALAAARYLTLSTGERMRVLLARALIGGPQLLLLDEPTAGLDLVAREALVDQIESMSNAPDGPAVLLITHHVEELPRAARQVILMRDGQVTAAGPPAQTLTESELQTAFGRRIELRERDGRYAARLA